MSNIISKLIQTTKKTFLQINFYVEILKFQIYDFYENFFENLLDFFIINFLQFQIYLTQLKRKIIYYFIYLLDNGLLLKYKNMVEILKSIWIFLILPIICVNLLIYFDLISINKISHFMKNFEIQKDLKEELYILNEIIDSSTSAEDTKIISNNNNQLKYIGAGALFLSVILIFTFFNTGSSPDPGLLLLEDIK